MLHGLKIPRLREKTPQEDWLSCSRERQMEFILSSPWHQGI